MKIYGKRGNAMFGGLKKQTVPTTTVGAVTDQVKHRAIVRHVHGEPGRTEAEHNRSYSQHRAAVRKILERGA